PVVGRLPITDRIRRALSCFDVSEHLTGQPARSALSAAWSGVRPDSGMVGRPPRQRHDRMAGAGQNPPLETTTPMHANVPNPNAQTAAIRNAVPSRVVPAAWTGATRVRRGTGRPQARKHEEEHDPAGR